MALDVAMGGSTNTVLHILAAAHEAERGLHPRRHRRGQPPGAVPVARSRRTRTSTWRTSTAPAASPRILGELDRGRAAPPRRPRGARPTRWRRGWAAGTSAARRRPTRRVELFHAAPGGVRTTRAVLDGQPLELARHRRGDRLHPRRRARLLRRRRPRGADRQPRPRRRRDQDAPASPEDVLALPGPGAGRRVPGGGRLGHPQARGAARRRRRRALRGPRRRAGHAGDAAPDRVPQGRGSRRGVRADHRRALLRRVVGHQRRAHLARGRRGRHDRRSSRRATRSSSTSTPAGSSCSSTTTCSPSAAPRWRPPSGRGSPRRSATAR